MGTLRIKRGTKTALQTSPGYVPAEGELVYTTDSKEVFVGDGATTGGTPVSVSTQNLEDLGNVQALAAQNDQILVYNGQIGRQQIIQQLTYVVTFMVMTQRS